MTKSEMLEGIERIKALAIKDEYLVLDGERGPLGLNRYLAEHPDARLVVMTAVQFQEFTAFTGEALAAHLAMMCGQPWPSDNRVVDTALRMKADAMLRAFPVMQGEPEVDAAAHFERCKAHDGTHACALVRGHAAEHFFQSS